MDRRAGEQAGGGLERNCGHDEAGLKSAAEQLGRAEDEARLGERLAGRGHHAEWSGGAGDSYRARLAFVVAELAAVTAGIVGLAILVASLEREAQDCAAVRAVADAASRSDAPMVTLSPRLPITEARGPLLPQVSRGPLIPQETRGPLIPFPSGNSTPPRADEVCR